MRIPPAPKPSPFSPNGTLPRASCSMLIAVYRPHGLLAAAGSRPKERELREFVFCAPFARAATRSGGAPAPCAQRMYAGVRRDQWRVAFALSERCD